MSDLPDKEKASGKSQLIQYAGMGAQFFAALLLGVFGGKWLDEKLAISFPVLIWLLPLILLVGMLVKIVRDTSKKKNE
jgi:hypothetical protein